MSVRLVKIGCFILFITLSILLYQSLVFIVNIYANHPIIGTALFNLSILLYCLSISYACDKANTYCKDRGQDSLAIRSLIILPWICFIMLSVILIYSLPYYYIKLGYLFWGYISIAAILLLLILLLTSYIIIKYTSLFKIKIILRRSVYIYIWLCLSIICVGSIITAYDCKNSIPLIGTDILIYLTAVRACDIYMMAALFFNIYIVLREYTNRYYNLYLRNFVYDRESSKNNCIELIREVSNRDVLRIGNPNTLFSLDPNCATFYLPKTNWQEEVSKLIYKAGMCFIVLDVSDGVMWEACYHLPDKNKFIYHISDAKKIDQICVKLKNHTTVNNVQEFAKYINLIKDNIPANNISCYTFVIRDNAIYCSHDIKSIIRFWQSGKRQILTDDIIMIEHHNTL